MKLRTVTEKDLPKILQWRREYPESLRTPYELTDDMQHKWFEDVVNNRDSSSKYWIIQDDADFEVGYGNLSNIQWENRFAEIGLLIDKSHLGMKKGVGAVKLLLEMAFMYMNLDNIWGECYYCNPRGLDFWNKVSYITFKTELPMRKYYNGKYWPSLYFNIKRETWLKATSGNRWSIFDFVGYGFSDPRGNE